MFELCWIVIYFVSSLFYIKIDTLSMFNLKFFKSPALSLYIRVKPAMFSPPVYGVKIAACDSSLLLSVAYQKFESHIFEWLVQEEAGRYDNLNFFLTRNDDFWTADGRTENLEGAKKIDKEILELLKGDGFNTICCYDYDYVVNKALKYRG